MATDLEYEARRLVGKNWGTGSGTNEKLLGNIRRIAQFMRSQGLQSIKHMKTKHVKKFFEHLSAEKLEGSTKSGYATAMRKIANAIGKKNIMPMDNASVEAEREGRNKPKKADVQKMSRVRENIHHEWQRLAFDLQKAFGLREKESLMSHKIREVEGVPYLDIEGAKGGRWRQLPIDTPEREDIVNRVREYLTGNKQKSLMPPEKTLKQALKSQSNAIHRAGGTKTENANSHLFRHEAAQEMERQGHTAQEIAKSLGHNRTSAVRHYCSGGGGKQKK